MCELVKYVSYFETNEILFIDNDISSIFQIKKFERNINI